MVVLRRYDVAFQATAHTLPSFFEQPILNSPYGYPQRHWELDAGRPTHRIVERRREVSFVTPIPKPKGQRGQRQLALDEAAAEVDSANQQYQHAHVIKGVRQQVAAWRELPERQWKVTPETARLLRHWRHHSFAGIRPFFCQVEAAETAIWLMEVAPKLGRQARSFLDHLQEANDQANPGLNRLALKLATGAGKTTVMAMLIAWQTVNAVHRPNSPRFTRGFLVVTPGITIRDRLRVLCYVANQGLGFTVPYRMGGDARTYIPDFIVRVDDGHGAENPLNLVVEVKGYRRENAKVKKQTMENYWVPAVNELGDFGRWAFVELKDVYTMRGDVDAALKAVVGDALAPLLAPQVAGGAGVPDGDSAMVP